MDKLTPIYQTRLQNIIQYYTEYRKTHYDDNVEIMIENQRREEEKKEINRELQKLQKVKTTEKYVLLRDDKTNICEKIDKTYEQMDENEDNIELTKVLRETLESLFNSLETIEIKQEEIIKDSDVNTEFLENHLKTIRL